jgi:predicted RNA-binding Zn ribbon-like protein
MVPLGFLFVGERVAVDLLNTVIAQDGRVRDLLAKPGDVAAWAAAAGVVPVGAFTPSALSGEPNALRTFREALRRGLLGWRASGRPNRRLVALLNRHLARDAEVTEARLEGARLTIGRRSTSAPRDRLYGAVARSTAELLERGDPRRLRKCANPACRLMFYDVSKAGRRRWCSMQMCGARAKVSAFRARRTTPSSRRRGNHSA